MRTTTKKLKAAVEIYFQRKDRLAHPAGQFDEAGRWYPAYWERCPCCQTVRPPSRSWPYSLMVHCRTIEHVARLYRVEPEKLRAAVRAARPPRQPDRTPVRFTTVAKVGGRYFRIFDGSEYVLGQERREACRPGHGDGFYVYETEREAADADVPTSSKLAGAERAILRVRCGGRCLRHGGGKRAYSRVTPLDEV